MSHFECVQRMSLSRVYKQNQTMENIMRVPATAFAFLSLMSLAACQPTPPLGSPEAAALPPEAKLQPVELPTPDTAVPRSTDAGNQSPTEGVSPTVRP